MPQSTQPWDIEPQDKKRNFTVTAFVKLLSVLSTIPQYYLSYEGTSVVRAQRKFYCP